MVDFQAFNQTSHSTVELINDYNNLLAQALRQGYNFVVYQNGGYTEAIKGNATTGGTIAYGGANDAGAIDGTDSAAVINAALGGLTAARTYKQGIKVIGNYTLGSTLTVDGYTTLDLRDAKFTLDDSVDDDCILITDTDDYIDILGGWLQGNSAGNASGHGIHVQNNSQEITITGTKIRDFKESGIRVGTASSGLMHISHCVITSNTEHGIFVSSFSDSFIHDCDIGANGYNGLYMGSSGANRVANCGFWLNNQTGGNASLYLYECLRTVVSGCIFHDNYRNGLQISGTTADRNCQNTITGNLFYDNGELAANTYYDISLSDQTAEYNTIIGNTFDSDDVKYNIFLTGTNPYPKYNTIVGNTFKDAVTLHIGATGTIADNHVSQNSGYVTENCGTATISNGNTFVDVTHGLQVISGSGVTPTAISVVGQHQEVVTLTVTSVGATTFRCTTTVGATTADRTILWRAWYHP